MKLPIRQLAYYVSNIEAAAHAHNASFGSGPFFAFRHVPLAHSAHRGVPRTFDHSSAYGQWGDLMIEFVELHSDEPSAISDLYPTGSGRFGLHHTAVMVESLEAAIAEFEAGGIELAQLSETTTGTRFAFMDASAPLGHMIELYEASEGLIGFYDMVRTAAQDWDGTELISELGDRT